MNLPEFPLELTGASSNLKNQLPGGQLSKPLRFETVTLIATWAALSYRFQLGVNLAAMTACGSCHLQACSSNGRNEL